MDAYVTFSDLCVFVNMLVAVIGATAAATYLVTKQIHKKRNHRKHGKKKK